VSKGTLFKTRKYWNDKKLNVLGRSLRQLIETTNRLQSKGVEFVSLPEAVETRTSGGKLVVHVFGALAEFEREMIRERTKAGLRAARERGSLNGRPKKLTKAQIKMARSLMKNPLNKSSEICSALKISRSTLYRYCMEEKKSR
jgi:DNA invertase Pin-like site-specific DNA recombinase